MKFAIYVGYELDSRYSVPVTLPRGTRVLGKNHEMVLLELPAGFEG